MYRKLRNISQAFILIFALSFSFAGCKKRYEEGSLISFESPCKRIGKEWKLAYLFIDGIDSTSYMNAVSDSGSGRCGRIRIRARRQSAASSLLGRAAPGARLVRILAGPQEPPARPDQLPAGAGHLDYRAARPVAKIRRA